jgi:outer membrane receptor protein involved in Fe transport
VKYLAALGLQQGATTEEVISGSITGDLDRFGMKSPLANHAVSIALGAEYREETLQNEVDREFSSGDLAGSGPTQSVTGRFDVAEGFGEVRAPLIENAPFAELLQLEAGYRYSSYSTAGPLTTYKVGGQWQPIDDVRFRATYQRAARAPNILELFTPQSFGGWFSGGGGDPCGTDELLTQAQCDRTNRGKHLDGYGTPLLDCPDESCSSIVGGSTALKPEVAVTQSVGVVLTPGYAPGFSATIDYFDIKIANVVGTFPQSIVLEACGVGGSQFFCSMIHRAPGSGILYGTSGYIDSLNRNAGFLHSNGADLEADYETDLSNWGLGSGGTLAFNALGTWTGHYVIEPVPAAALTEAGIPSPYSADCVGLFGVVCGIPIPKWRHKVRVTWTAPWDMSVSLQWRHSSAVELDLNTSNPILNAPCGGPCGDTSDARIGPYDYFDLTLAWTLSSGAEIRAGVNNAFDTDPPVIDSGLIGAPLGYDLLGRTIFVAYTIKM